MNNDQLAGKYARLREELALAYEQPLLSPSRSGLIERLAAELLEVERRLAVLQQNSTLAPVRIDAASFVEHQQDSPRMAA